MSSLSVEEYVTIICSIQNYIPEDIILLIFNNIDNLNYELLKIHIKSLNKEFIKRRSFVFIKESYILYYNEEPEFWNGLSIVGYIDNNFMIFNARNINELPKKQCLQLMDPCNLIPCVIVKTINVRLITTHTCANVLRTITFERTCSHMRGIHYIHNLNFYHYRKYYLPNNY